MKYLFFTNTPAQAHQYRHAVTELEARGHEVLVLARDYGCTEALLDYYDVPYELYGRCDTEKFSLFRELPKHYARAIAKTVQYGPDCIFGRGSYAAFAGAVSRAPVVLVDDSETTGLDHALSTPFTDAFLTPHTFEKNLGANHYEFQGFKELAYLHPDTYEPQTDIREELGLGTDEEYAIVRFNAFGSHHDVGREGFTSEKRRRLVDALAERVTVFISDEGGDMDLSDAPARAFDCHPALLHDTLAEASLLVADTQTMVTEAALLGTPAIRSNSFVGDDDMGNFVDLERHGLIYNLREFDAVLTAATDLLDDDKAADRWQKARDDFIADKVNLTEVIVAVAEQVHELGGADNVDALARVGGVTRRESGRTGGLALDAETVRSDGGRR